MDIESYLTDLYPGDQEIVEQYIRCNGKYLDDELEKLYNKFDAEEAVEILSELVISKALNLQLQNKERI